MKNLGVICMMLLILSIALKDLVTYVKFQVNRDYLTENYCINKDAVELNCHASCYLDSELSDNHDEKNFVVPQLSELSSLILICDLNIQYLNHTFAIPKENITFHKEYYKYSYLSDIFRPPCS